MEWRDAPLGLRIRPRQEGKLKRYVEEEAEVVRAAFQALLTQGSVSQAAKWLNRKGYGFRGPLRGGGCKPRFKHFTFDSLYRLLSNPAFAGEYIKAQSGKVEIVPAV